MPLSWNEIKTRALAFSKEWENESSEDAEAKSFWDGFFNVFGVPRRYVSTFLSPFVKKIFIIFFPDSESLHSPVSTV